MVRMEILICESSVAFMDLIYSNLESIVVELLHLTILFRNIET